ncbi:MAG TPA: carboxypeptidase-like regulatory domain-containing protein, partial [Terriglobia bacterium]|nr:carboxypeptidase-like regulatory domain-containing protein [Terriglobia bacterium]
MTSLLMLFSLLLQAPAPRQRPPVPPPAPPQTAAISGVVLQSGSAAPMANVTVTLARLDAELGGFAEMVAGDRPPMEVTLSASMLSIMTQAMAQEAQADDLPPEEAAQMKAMMSLPIDDIDTITVSPNGNIAVISKSHPPALTDEQGRFAFTGLAPGRYRVTFTANGFARQDFGQRGSGGSSTPIVLAAGQAKSDIVMRMTAVAAISGRLNDRAGRPIAGVPVDVTRFVWDENGQRKTERVASAQSDDRGQYRIFYLTPGRYYLGAGNPPGGGASTGALPPELAILTNVAQPTANRVPQNYSVSYYPGVPDINSAVILDVAPAAELRNMDLTLELQQPYRVRGQVLDPGGGQTPQNATITFQPRDADPLQAIQSEILLSRNLRDSRPTYNPADGSFEAKVAPGAYIATANVSRPGAGTVSGSAIVEVSNSDVEGVLLVVAPPAPVSGTVQFEPGAEAPDGNFGPLRIQFRQLDRPTG